MSFIEGHTQLAVLVEAAETGSDFNWAPGYNAILPEPFPGLVQMVNSEQWLTYLGEDRDPNDQLRLRIRNRLSAVYRR